MYAFDLAAVNKYFISDPTYFITSLILLGIAGQISGWLMSLLAFVNCVSMAVFV